MSLLNEMLKDLSRKKQQPKISGLLAIQTEKRPFFETNNLGIYFLIVLLVNLSLFFIFYYRTQISTRLGNVISSKQESPKDAIEILPSELVPIPYLQSAIADENMIDEPQAAFASDEIVEQNTRDMATGVVNAIDLENKVNKTYNEMDEQEWSNKQLNKAIQAIEEGNDGRGIQLLNELLTKNPSSIDARENLAAVYLNYGEIDKANQIISEGLEFEPSSLQLIVIKARILIEQNRPQIALNLLKRFNPDINNNPEFYGVLAAVLDSLGRTTEAGSLYQALIKIDPDNGQYWLGYGLALEQKNAIQQAIDAYKRASISNNTDTNVRGYAESRLKVLQG